MLSGTSHLGCLNSNSPLLSNVLHPCVATPLLRTSSQMPVTHLLLPLLIYIWTIVKKWQFSFMFSRKFSKELCLDVTWPTFPILFAVVTELSALLWSWYHWAPKSLFCGLYHIDYILCCTESFAWHSKSIRFWTQYHSSSLRNPVLYSLMLPDIPCIQILDTPYLFSWCFFIPLDS